MSFSDLAAKRSARLKQQQHQQQQRDKMDDVTDDIASDKKPTDDNPINPINRPISILNDDIQVEQTSTKGRGVFARRDIKRGTTVLSTKATMIALEHSYLDKHCSYTAIPGGTHGKPPLARCSLCKKTHYISKHAQRLDWPVHKRECECLRAAKTTPEDSIRLMARLVWMRDCKRADGDTDWEKQLDGLHETYDLLSEEDKVGLGERVRQFALYFTKGEVSRLQNSDVDVSIPYAMRLLNKIQTNAFALQNSDAVGVAIAPLAALVNHDMHPNCTSQFTRADDTLSVVLFKDVKKGQEITTSYVDQTLPWDMQRDALWKQYRFDIGECPKDNNEGSGNVDKDTLLNTVNAAEKFYFDDPLRAFQRLQPYYDTVESAYAPASRVRVRYLRVCFAIMITIAQLDNMPTWAPRLTVELGRKTVGALKLILPYGHPIRALTLAEVAKQMLADSGEERNMMELAVVDKLEKCVLALDESRMETQIGYGKDSALEGYLVEEIEEIRKEIQMRRLATVAV
ncbi:hypothetical protein E3P89_03250 [Wallemia ichthyophaga]|uniref:SET domain-containing protein n=1 Tax=Wallemia ichthyophaga TaxID=245174 RepID=A0A4T0G6E1_WALIC|nr:hypothetical protein E3P95_03190 [Wallemia ichthyophaga]TIA97883.1 hypothetical protein E3P94_03150 [Wallemia ichthyophaga]TIB09425.1 hypothetical protein E3P93_03201 [Wallemia ichthyophaga]TIB09583.1 hypothetical protein E3P90_03232 [Wallemia ichthyophaga]TIB20387.1 hypothetical protein E3P89_03250 [Wallemia ichthyophaga]